MKISSTLYEYLFQNPKYKVEVKKRAYDGLYNLTRPNIQVDGHTGEHSIIWETLGVYQTENQANEAARKFFKGRKAS